MQSRKGESVFYYQSSASALGGFLEKPFPMSIPSQAAAVLPAVGGFATANTEAFNLQNIISCSRASVRVSGRSGTGGVSIVVTSVIESLNLLEVVTADRIVAQASVEYTKDGRKFSLAGTRFEKLRLGGRDVHLDLNKHLLAPELAEPAGNSRDSRLGWDGIRAVGSWQAAELVRAIKLPDGPDKPERQDRIQHYDWALKRYEWMVDGARKDAPPGVDTYTLCSIVNQVSGEIPGTCLGHVVEIPDFGRIFLGELLVSGTSFQLSMIRAELGCNVTGGTHIGTCSGGGHTGSPRPVQLAVLTALLCLGGCHAPATQDPAAVFASVHEDLLHGNLDVARARAAAAREQFCGAPESGLGPCGSGCWKRRF